MNTFNCWYEVSIILEAGNKRIHDLSTGSLEQAENRKAELVEAGLKAVVEVWDTGKEKPVLIEEI
jgi:hypothetical protein